MTPKQMVLNHLKPTDGLSIVHLYRELGGLVSLVDVKNAVKSLIGEGLCTSKIEGIIPIYFRVDKKK